MQTYFIALTLLFSAAAFANDTSSPAIFFNNAEVRSVVGHENDPSSLGVDLYGGSADKLFQVLGESQGTGPKEFYDSFRTLNLIANGGRGSVPVMVSITCKTGEYDFTQRKMRYWPTTKCSVDIINDHQNQSNTKEYEVPACLTR